ncbi:MAG TPA: class I SAM-dependent methyltransferase [Burkholderiaceae bacterium]
MPNKLRHEVEQVLGRIPIDFGGGCSVRKAYVMAWLIGRFGLERSLDIGVYRGRSLFPQAVAHKLAGRGVAYGVDPWSAAEADESDHTALREQIKAFVANTDFEQLYRDVMRRVGEFGVGEHTRIVRTTSAEAAKQFAADGVTFGLIHIDGNHDTEPVLRDVRAYLPLLQPGGFLVMDDVSWPSVEPAVHEAERHTKLLLRRVSADKADDYAVLRKPGGTDAMTLGLRLHLLAGT